MNQNLSAAVERLIVDCRHPFDGGVHCLSRIDDVETILAELGRGSGGELVYQVTFHDDKIAWFDADQAEYESRTDDTRRIVIIQPKMKLHFSREWLRSRISSDPDLEVEAYTRPPVAGLAELTDEQWWHLYVAMDDVTPLGGPFSITNVATAAREFLGKVDG